MKSSQFMDKQITGLSGTQDSDFLDLLNPPLLDEHQNNGAVKKEEMFPSYDFQPIRTVASSSSPPVSLDGARPWGSADSKVTASNIRNYSSLEANESSKVIQEKVRDAYDTATVTEIDRTVKKYADTLLHALESVSSRLSQLESRTRHLESSLDDLKVSTGNSSGGTDGKLRQLENILREVQTGVQVLRDKQEIQETQMQLVKKLQASKADHHQPPEENSNGDTSSDYRQQPAPSLQLPLQHSLQPQVAYPQPPPPPPPNAPPPPPPQQNPPLLAQFPPQVPQTQIPSTYFPQPAQSPESMHQQYQMPPQPPTQVPPQPPTQVPPQQQYQPSPQFPQYSPPPQQSQSINPAQLQPSLSHHSEESAPYMAYPPSHRPPSPLNQPPSGPPPPQQFYGPGSNLYEPPPPPSRQNSGQLSFSSGYGPPSGPGLSSESYPYSGSPSHRSGSSMKQPPPFQSTGSSGGSNYPRLPTAQVLPQALPTGSSSSGGGSTGGNRVPIDDVVDKVSTMGFSRDQVRATVRKLTENGQSVDLNVVLDKLMNDGEMIQPQKGWFGR